LITTMFGVPQVRKGAEPFFAMVKEKNTHPNEFITKILNMK